MFFVGRLLNQSNTVLLLVFVVDDDDI